MSPIKVCFLGTPEFAAVHLSSLLANSNYKVVGVVTQPDRPAGRRLQLTPSSVKTLALENNIPVLAPESLKKDSEVLAKIKSWQADVAVVVAFGQILTQEFLDSFKFGAVNIHGSLLPLWRGAAPIQRSIEAGDTQTGVSLQCVVKKLDAGPIVGKRIVQLDDKITAVDVYKKLSVLGCELIAQDLAQYIKGEIQPQQQDESKATYAVKIDKGESLLNWNLSAESIHNRVRAFTMGPGTYVIFQNQRLKIHKTKIIDKESTGIPGVIALVNSSELHIQTSCGILAILEVQPESRSKISIEEFLQSNSRVTYLKQGDLFV